MPLGAKEKQVGIWNLEGKGGHLRGFGKSKCLVSRRLRAPQRQRDPEKSVSRQVLQSLPTCWLLPTVDTAGDSSVQEAGSSSKFFQAFGGGVDIKPP